MPPLLGGSFRALRRLHPVGAQSVDRCEVLWLQTAANNRSSSYPVCCLAQRYVGSRAVGPRCSWRHRSCVLVRSCPRTNSPGDLHRRSSWWGQAELSCSSAGARATDRSYRFHPSSRLASELAVRSIPSQTSSLTTSQHRDARVLGFVRRCLSGIAFRVGEAHVSVWSPKSRQH